MENCLFCNIARKQIESSWFYEDEVALAFLDVHPCAEGHALVIPKIHAETLLDLPEKFAGPFMFSVQHAIEKLHSVLSPHGFTIGINHGKAGGQAIDHLHVHIIPRQKGDGGGSIHSIVQAPWVGDLALLAEKLRGLEK